MNLEKYPGYFLAVCILYAIVFLTIFGYVIIPITQLGFFSELYLITILMFLPMVLIAAHHFTARIHFLWGKESLLRTIITVLTIIDFLITVLFMSALI